MNWETFNSIIIPILIAIGGLVVVIVGSVTGLIRRQDKILEAMAAREEKRIESDTNRSLAAVERDKLFNGLVTGLQEEVKRVEEKYDRLDQDYRKEVERGHVLNDTVAELHKQTAEVPFLRHEVDMLRKQVEGIQESRAQRELQLQEANNQIAELTKELERRTARIAELEAQIEQHDARLTNAEEIIRATPVDPIPVVTVDSELPKAG